MDGDHRADRALIVVLTCACTLTLLLGVAASAWSLPAPGAGRPDPELAPVPTGPARPSSCRGWVALTFDDGPTPLTPSLLDHLGDRGLPAVFFNTGERAALAPQVVQAERALPGAQIGNHSWDHPDLTTLPEPAVRSQLRRTTDVLGADVRLFRPPFGSSDPAVEEQAERLGLLQVLWTLDSKDYEATTVGQVVRQSAGMRDGGILLLHDGHPLTIKALPAIVRQYYARGLCFGRVAPSRTAQVPAESPDRPFYARAVAP